MKVVIIEDELLAREELIRLIKKNFPDFEIIACLDSVTDSVKWFKTYQADLIFLDIHLADGIGFEIFEQMQITTYALTEDGKFRSGTNMLTQLKFTVSKEFAPHLKVFAGPVLNMTISDHVNPETGKLGSSLSPWSMWKNDSDKTRVNSWIGISAGVRF